MELRSKSQSLHSTYPSLREKKPKFCRHKKDDFMSRPATLKCPWVDPCTAHHGRYAQSLKPTCLPEKFGSCLDHAKKMGEKVEM